MKRINRPEILDTGEYTPEEYQKCLKQLGRIGRLLGGDRITLSSIQGSPKTILDVGCGGGDFTIRLGEAYPNSRVFGTDICKEALDYAKAQAHPDNVTFCEHYDEPVDLWTCTLVCHHLSDEEIVTFLKDAKSQAKQVVINDLHRHPLAYLAFLAVSPLFANRLIFHDGPLSIRRAFTKKDWTVYLREAGVENYTIKWRWPFRWIVSF